MRPTFYSNVSTSVEISNQRKKEWWDTKQDIFKIILCVFELFLQPIDIQTQTLREKEKKTTHTHTKQ